MLTLSGAVVPRYPYGPPTTHPHAAGCMCEWVALPAAPDRWIVQRSCGCWPVVISGDSRRPEHNAAAHAVNVAALLNRAYQTGE